MASAGDCARGLEKRRPLEKRRSHLFRFPRVKGALVAPAKLGKGHGRGLQNLEAHKLHGAEEIYGQRSVKACVRAQFLQGMPPITLKPLKGYTVCRRESPDGGAICSWNVSL